MDWAQILVITLAVLFSIFLIVAIALVVMILKVTMQMRAMATGAERTLHALEGSVGAFRRTALPLVIAKGIVSHLTKQSKKKQE